MVISKQSETTLTLLAWRSQRSIGNSANFTSELGSLRRFTLCTKLIVCMSRYYTGVKVAPLLTIIIGGNHEASNYLWELQVVCVAYRRTFVY